MSLEMEKRIVKVNKALNKDMVQNMVEGDIIVPDSKPDVINIINADATVKVHSIEVNKDNVTTRGIVNYTILYISDDPSRFVCSMEYSTNFEHQTDMFGVEANMKCFTNSTVEHVDCNILNGRKVNIKAILNTSFNVAQFDEVPVVSNIADSENAQILTKSFEGYNSIQGDNIEYASKYQVEIPIGKAAVKQVLRTDATIKDKDVKFTGEKAIVRANIELKTLYVPDMESGSIEYVVNEVPFSEVFAVDSVEDCIDVDINTRLTDLITEVKEDDDGDSRVLDYDVTIQFEPSYLQKQSFEVISDAYSLNSKYELEKNQVKINNVVGDNKSQSTVRNTIVLSQKPPVKEMYNVSCNGIITNTQIEDDKVYVEGIIEAKVTYFSGDEENPIGSHKHEIPFNHTVDIKGAMSCMKPEARVEIENCNYDIVNEKEIDLKVTMTVFVRVSNEEFYDVVTKIEEFPIDDKKLKAKPSMTIYYIQNGDSLWNIAKKYLTTINDILKMNDLQNTDAIEVGQQILIPKVI